jgi:hypothetical protein
MTSWTERNRRRGAISYGEFLAAMQRAGFVEEMHVQPDVLHAFTHPATPDGRYFVMLASHSYSAALERITAELDEARRRVSA